MADTVGRLTGEPGVCLVTAGPGATNSLTGVATAYASASPMTHLSGATPPKDQVGSFHGVDDPFFLEEIFKPVTKMSTRIDNPSKAPEILSKSFALSKTGRKGPVHISLPQRFQQQVAKVGRYNCIKITPRRATAAQLRRISTMLGDSKKPVICLGEEAVHLPAKEIIFLAEKISAPVISIIEALGVFPQNHRLFAGYFDEYFEHPISTRVIEGSDCMLIVGLRPASPCAKFLETHGSPDKAFLYEESIPAASEDPAAIGDINLNTHLLAQSVSSKEQIDRRNWLHGEKLAAHKYTTNQIAKWHKTIHPGYAMAALIPFLQNNCILATDVGSSEVWVRDCVTIWHRSRHLYAGQYGAMGFGLPAGIASKLLYPNRQVISIVGDGGLLMSNGELATVAQHAVDLKIIVLNDSRLGMIWQLQRQRFAGRYASVDLSRVNFARVAQGFGLKGVRVEDQNELRRAYEQILNSKGPGLLDIVIDPEAPYLF
jgi:acetolactate synthase-1/2/3 large subunit